MDVVVCTRPDFRCLSTSQGGVTDGDAEVSTGGTGDAECRLVETVLHGGAPWGFTLRGGREHREPLLITKVEESSKACAAGVEVGDEMAAINGVPLTGYRQEAICLVKGSHKTLSLTLRRKMKMVDIVTQTMPAENEVHVARNFLTKILRSSMRKNRFKGRNDSASRPHSWHASKLVENQPETQKIQQNPEPEPIWQAKHSISSSSNDVSKWDTAKQHPAPSQITQPQDMEAVAVLSQTSSSSNSTSTSSASASQSLSKHLSSINLSCTGPNRKRDPPHPHAPNSLSVSPNNLDHNLSKTQAASMECMFYRGTQAVGEAVGHPERPRYLHLPMGNGGRVSPRLEDQVGTRYSSSSFCAAAGVGGVSGGVGGGVVVGGGRMNISPVWHVPENKKGSSSPPPPPPPTRSDSYAATKVHEKGVPVPHPQGGSATYPQQKALSRSTERLFKASENLQVPMKGGMRHSTHGFPTAQQGVQGDTHHLHHHPAEDHNANLLPHNNPSKLSSLSSTDVRGPGGLAVPGAAGPDHQRQHSDESHLNLHPKSALAGAQKIQSVGGYYRSLQDLPANLCGGGGGRGTKGRTSASSLSSTALDQRPDHHQKSDQNHGGVGGGGGSSRYYYAPYHQQQQTYSMSAPQGSKYLAESWRSDSDSPQTGSGSEKSGSGNGSHRAVKNKYPAGHHGHGQGQAHNGYSKPMSAPQASEAGASNVWMARSSSDERKAGGVSIGGHGQPHSEPGRAASGASQLHHEPPSDPLWVTQQEGRKICPQQTPLLHSLAQESKLLTGKRSPPSASSTSTTTSTTTGATMDTTTTANSVNSTTITTAGGSIPNQGSPDPGGNKQGRRSDRYATTLRNEIIIKRAQLQKSRSAAALSCPGEADEEQEQEAGGVWKSAETSTSSSDGSFSNTYKDHLKEAQARVLQATSFKRKDLELHGGSEVAGAGHGNLSVAEILTGKASGNHVSRIGGRKRFPASKRVHSFSEPDKINEVGVEGKGLLNLEPLGSFVDRRMFFEGVTQPPFARPSGLKPGPLSSQTSPEEHTNVGGKAKAMSTPADGHHHGGHARDNHHKHPSGKDHGWPKPDLLEQQRQRLGTFAEYEATWNLQRKQVEGSKSSGRYRSAENILEPSVEEWNQATCVHERSRSSPSADFYKQKLPLPGRKTHVDQTVEAHTMGVQPDKGQVECPSATRESPSSRTSPTRQDTPTALPPNTTTNSTRHHPATNTPEPPPYNEHLRHVGVTAALESHPHPHNHHKKKGVATLPQRHSPPRVDTAGPATDQANSLIPQRDHSDPHTGHASRVKSPGFELGSVPNNAVTGPMPTVPNIGPGSEGHPQVSPCPDRELLLGMNGGSRGRLEEEWRALHQTAVAALEPSSLASTHHPQQQQPHPHHPLPPSSSSSCPSGHKGGGGGNAAASLTLTVSQNVNRSPSPQFAPLRLTDKPPNHTQDNVASSKMSNGVWEPSHTTTPANSTSKKVPVRILHAETSLERKGRNYLLDNNGGPHPHPHPHPHAQAEPQSGAPQTHSTFPTSQEHAYSLFCAYSQLQHQREVHHDKEVPRVTSSPPGAPGHQEAPKGLTQNGQARSPSLGLTTTHSSSGDLCLDEEAKREELARDIMGKDKSLADILDQSRMRTTMDLMGGIFPPAGEQVPRGEGCGAQLRRRSTPRQTSPRNSDESRRVEDDLATAVSVVSSSSYYSTSAPKAELLIKMKDMQQDMDTQDSEDELDQDLSSKKQELISSLSQKLQVLQEARESLQEDVQDNNALGQEVEATVQAVCKPNQLDKFRMFIGDLDKVVSLLLSLSGRLARVENALDNLEEGASPEEKHALTEKRRLLIRQHEDAKELKENLDRRERLVYDILASYLSAESLADYQHFVKMKSALIIEQRKLEDKIKLGEEQLKCLRDSLPLEQRLML